MAAQLKVNFNFNQSFAFSMARTMQDLAYFVFVNLANITLVRHDSYLDHLKSGIKHDTLATVWSIHCSNGIHNSSQGSETVGSKQG